MSIYTEEAMPRKTLSHVLTKEFLVREYVENGRTTNSIATEVGCSHTAVNRHLVLHGIRLRRKGKPNKNIAGKKFGKLTAVRPIGRVSSENRLWKWHCLCECGGIAEVGVSQLINGDTQSCGCLLRRCGPDSSQWQGGKYVPLRYLKSVMDGAKQRDIPCAVTMEEIDSLLEQQEFRCALSGLPIGFTRYRGENTASLDRIDSDFGYILGNVQWVHKDINKMKNTLPNDLFVSYCKAIAKWHNAHQAVTDKERV